MQFSIKHKQTSKCEGCVHAHIITPAKALEGEKVTICKMLGFGVGPIRECNNFTPHVHSGIPIHMLASAWLLDPKEQKDKQVGFRITPPKHLQDEA